MGDNDAKDLKAWSEELQQEQAERDQREQQLKDAKAVEIATHPIRLDDVRNEINLMRYPFFSTDQKPRYEPITYTNGKRYLTARPATGLAMATQRDADILRYVIKKMIYSRDRSGGGRVQGVNVTRHELLTHVFGGNDGAANYKDLDDKIRRLTLTTYETNVFSVDPDGPKHSGSMVTATIWEDEAGISKICFLPCEALEKSIRRLNVKLLQLDFLSERGNLRKRLLEVVAVHIDLNKDKKVKIWSVGMEQLAALCAFTREPKQFKQSLQRAKLPYKLSFHKDRIGKQIVTFTEVNQ